MILLLTSACSAPELADAAPLAAEPADAVPPAEPASWPIQLFEDPEITTADLDADGVADVRADSRSIGSGWHGFATCVRHGATGHVACREDQDTAYSGFSGTRTTLRPVEGNRAAGLLGSFTCERWKPHDPRWGALEAVGTPLEGVFRPVPRWEPGPVVQQVSACLTPAEARRFPGSDAWSGTPADASWTVFWTPRTGVSWGQQEAGLRQVATAGPLAIFQQGAALAVYDAARAHHAWIANWSEADDGFKVDRWERIVAVEGAPGVVTVRLATLGEEETVTVRLPD